MSVNETTTNHATESGTKCVEASLPVAPWIPFVSYPRNSLVGQYLEGPRDPKKVRRLGYGFTTDPAKAWPFPNENQAKALIVDRHMGWGESTMVTGPLADEMQNPEVNTPNH